MKRTLRIVAAILAIAALVFWLAAGANRSWTVTSIERKVPDPITGLDKRQWEPAFVPGIDFIGAALAAAAGLAGVSFLFGKKNIGN